jgi:hypothetical protein
MLDETSNALQASIQKQLKTSRGVAVGTYRDGNIEFGSLSETFVDVSVSVGCIAKCLTASIFASKTNIAFDTPVADLLRNATPKSNLLAGITVEHLLGHTHGLDDSAIGADVPRIGDGKIDIDYLIDAVTRPVRRDQPGSTYIYGGAGGWFLASILEQELNANYAYLLFDWLASIGVRKEFNPNVCPSWGWELSLSARELLQIIVQQVSQNNNAESLKKLRRSVVNSFPGWMPWYSGVTSGWNKFGEQWYGYNSNVDGAGIALRFCVDPAIAIAITANHEADMLAAKNRLFSDLLPETGSGFTTFPKLKRSPIEVARYIGSYSCARNRIEVSAIDDSSIALEYTVNKNGTASIVRRKLQPLDNDIFVPIPNIAEMQFIQFCEEASNGFRYLWNGQNIWLKETNLIQAFCPD